MQEFEHRARFYLNGEKNVAKVLLDPVGHEYTCPDCKLRVYLPHICKYDKMKSDISRI